MDKQYSIFLDDIMIGTSRLEKADAPMGVVFGMILFSSDRYDYEFFKTYCNQNQIELTADDPDVKLVFTACIDSLTVINPNGVEIRGVGNNIEGMDSAGFQITILGVPYPFYEEEFPHHVIYYNNMFKDTESITNSNKAKVTKQSNKLRDLLEKKSILFSEGLTDIELNMIEEKFNITFPIDLKLFLKAGLPISQGFVNWRKGLESNDYAGQILKRLNWPLEGMLFDIENDAFWVESWPAKPNSFEEQTEIATNQYLKYPKLIPIYSHRYIPSEPNEIGNPIFSVHQMDIIYYGYDLASYFSKEFGIKLPNNFEKLMNIIKKPTHKNIRFWSDFT